MVTASPSSEVGSLTDSPIRVDLHCHSSASNESDESVLNAIHCPESFSTPLEVFEQAKRRGMDFVTITDHDSIDGVSTLHARPDVLVGEELTCWFPEDRCKIHVLVWGISPQHHASLQSISDDIYKVADYLEREQIAHAVAHPVYRQNDILERWHLERLVLLFKGFEILNGAHSALHRESLEPFVDELTPHRINQLSQEHGLAARWPQPWLKSRTGGSDDHGLLNIGRTWTEFPAGTGTIKELLDCLRSGRCRPGGEAGSSLKLAHNFFGVGVRYFSRRFVPPGTRPSMGISALQLLVGEKRSVRKRDILKFAVAQGFKHCADGIRALMARPSRRQSSQTGSSLLPDLFGKSFSARIQQQPALAMALNRGDAPLGEHRAIFELVSSINGDIAKGIASTLSAALANGQVARVFDVLPAIALQQFLMLPYYFALSHQNRERATLERITERPRSRSGVNLKVGVFTDTFDEINGVVRSIRAMGEQAIEKSRRLVVHTCSDTVLIDAPYRKNFKPLVSCSMPLYGELKLTLPPLLEILEWADGQQFDVIHADTPGPMGVCGWLVAKMLRIPFLGTYHTDFPEYVLAFSGGDYRLASAATGYSSWFYGQMATVFSRSRHYRAKLSALNLSEKKIVMAHPCVDDTKFNPSYRDVNIWERLAVREPRRLMYCGRVSAEKNLALLVKAFRLLHGIRQDIALVVVGDGPFRVEMEAMLRGLPVYFLGYQDDSALPSLYASSDLFVFPSLTDTMGQAVIEAQASGLPVLVSDEGGPREMMDHGLTGLMVRGSDANEWIQALQELLNDEPRRQRMSRSAATRMARYTAAAAFDCFWNEHMKAAGQSTVDSAKASDVLPTVSTMA